MQKRIEIIGNRSIEEELFEKFNEKDIVKYFTKIPVVFGKGNSGPRMGDSIWPEENFLIIVYCDEDEARQVEAVVKEIKTYFKDEGLKLFETELVCTC